MEELKYKIKDGFVLKQIADSYFVLPTGAQTINFNCMITLNETGAFLWKELAHEMTEQELLNSMLDEYEITSEQALKDIEKFLLNLKNGNLLE